MRIISGHICYECCYCMEDYDDNGMCCKDAIYKPIKLSQSACRSFCEDGDNINYGYPDFNEDDFDKM